MAIASLACERGGEVNVGVSSVEPSAASRPGSVECMGGGGGGGGGGMVSGRHAYLPLPRHFPPMPPRGHSALRKHASTATLHGTIASF